ncbi:kinase-like domain, beta-lactamase/transpeptidase-like protein [Tanacetum coccineum]
MGLIFKVDIKKAYDSINWRFLINSMERMRFGEKCRKWVEIYLISSMSILVNGSLTEEFGLAIVNEAVSKGVFKGVKVGCFEEVSGVPVNYDKSKIYGIGVNEIELTEMATWMWCGVGELPFTYLGCRLGNI